jgi:hypothetical protein
MCPPLFQQRLELLLRGEGRLQSLDLADGVFERLFEGTQLVAGVARLHMGTRLSA